jgi:hypothetical protein
MNEELRTPRLRIVHNDTDPRDLDADLADLNNHLSRAQKLFKRIQPSNLEYELIRQKIANQEARERLGCFT